MRSTRHPSKVVAVASTPDGRPHSVSLPGVMVCLMLGPFINILDYNVVNVALPKMMSGLASDGLPSLSGSEYKTTVGETAADSGFQPTDI